MIMVNVRISAAKHYLRLPVEEDMRLMRNFVVVLAVAIHCIVSLHYLLLRLNEGTINQTHVITHLIINVSF